MIIDTAIVAIIVSFFTTVISWFVLHFLYNRREDRRRSIEAYKEHLQKQIEELYGPLYGLIQYGEVLNEVEQQRIPKDADDEKYAEIIDFIREKYYLPLNTRMLELIRSKTHLLDKEIMTKDLKDFLRHAAQFECFHKLYKERGIQSHKFQPIEYPADFKKEIKETLYALVDKYKKQIIKS